MRIFDTNVQKLKYDVLREVARHAYEDTLQDAYLDIPKTIAPGPEPTMRCCVYKERAIAAERVKLAMGGEKGDKNIIKIIDIACDECPVSTYRVTEDCRGCLAQDVYKRQIEDSVELENVILDKNVTVRAHGRLIGQVQYPIVIGKNVTL